MAKRRFIFGTYDTALTGLWTLTGWTLSPAEYIQKFVDVPGRIAGPLDLSTALTNGEPYYGQRSLVVSLESSEGTRLERESRIDAMVNWLSGWRVNITFPDDDTRYMVGRVVVRREYNDLAHAAVTVEAICEPWKYSVVERVVTLTAATTEKTATLTNAGRCPVIPLIDIETAAASDTVLLKFGTLSWALGPGVYKLPDIRLAQGQHSLTYSGAGTVKLTYREAVL